MRSYLKMLQRILEDGTVVTDRTGTGTICLYGGEMRFDLSEGFPLLTTKKVHLKSIIHELIWFLSGDTNIKYLQDNGVHIWDEWADENANLGPVYGAQWRTFAAEYFYTADGKLTSYGKTVDQLSMLIENIKKTPDSRRLIVSAWNPLVLEDQALPPCHMLFQVRIIGQKLHLLVYQRSADSFLGMPFNIASYALLTMMLAQVTGYEPGDLIMQFGDMHIYLNHMDQVNEQLSRSPHARPTMRLNSAVASIFDFRYEDFTLEGYDPHPAIKAPVAV